MESPVSSLQVEIADVGRQIFAGECLRIVAPAAHGEVCILPRHAPLLTALRPGEIRLHDTSGENRFFFVSGGFLEVKDSTVTVLADEILRSGEIDQERAQEAREQAEQLLRETHFPLERDLAKLNLAKALAQLRVLQHAEIHRLKQSSHH
jgi:F-type H+-transporting ATPase subunit epsilon